MGENTLTFISIILTNGKVRKEVMEGVLIPTCKEVDKYVQGLLQGEGYEEVEFSSISIDNAEEEPNIQSYRPTELREYA